MRKTLLREINMAKNPSCRIFLPTLFADAEAHTKKCDACPRYAKNDFHMDLPLYPTLPIAPLEKWDIDYIGPIVPTSFKQFLH